MKSYVEGGIAFSREMTTHWDIKYNLSNVIEAHREVLAAAVLRDGKWGFIDMHSKVVVEPQLDTLFPSSVRWLYRMRLRRRSRRTA